MLLYLLFQKVHIQVEVVNFNFYFSMAFLKFSTTKQISVAKKSSKHYCSLIYAWALHSLIPRHSLEELDFSSECLGTRLEHYSVGCSMLNANMVQSWPLSLKSGCLALKHTGMGWGLHPMLGTCTFTNTEGLVNYLLQDHSIANLVPRPRPAFCCFQYGLTSYENLGGAWERGYSIATEKAAGFHTTP